MSYPWLNYITSMPLLSLLVSTFQLHIAVGIPVKILHNCPYIFATMRSKKLTQLSLLHCTEMEVKRLGCQNDTGHCCAVYHV